MLPTESTLVLFGLFMIAAAAGWGFARYLDRRVRVPEEPPPSLSQGYVRALNLLLNQETDKALDLFVRMIATDDEALDTHFALGSLFRRQGEVERAIRIHQNILERPDLSEAQREAALSALGEDYLKAGLLDRAEGVFQQLRDSAADPEPALRNLIGIHETLGDWQRAIDERRELAEVSGESQALQIGHGFCELAEISHRHGDIRQAQQWLKLARKSSPTLMRALWQEARLADERGDSAQAWKLYEQVLRADTLWLPDLLQELSALAEVQHEHARLDALLRELLADQPQMQPRLAYAGIVSNQSRPAAVAEAVRAFIATNSALSSLVDIEGLSAEGGEGDAYLRRVMDGLRELADRLPRYQCGSCGYSTHRLVWQCPRCKSWETSKPVADLPYHALILRGEG